MAVGLRARNLGILGLLRWRVTCQPFLDRIAAPRHDDDSGTLHQRDCNLKLLALGRRCADPKNITPPCPTSTERGHYIHSSAGAGRWS